MITLTLTNTDTDEVIITRTVTKEEFPMEQTLWQMQVELYKIENPPINARLDVIDHDAPKPPPIEPEGEKEIPPEEVVVSGE